MDSDDKPIGRVLTRRDALRAASMSGLALILGGRANAVQEKGTKWVHLVATPEVEEGPFFVDEGMNRKNLLEGTDRKSVVNGLPLKVGFKVYVLSGKLAKPLADAVVDIWHADAAGTYSDEASGPIQAEDTKGQSWLRGHQVTDKEGRVEFETIYPGWYPSRTIHIHVKVRTFDSNKNLTHDFTTQVYFDEATNDAVLARAPYNERGKRRVNNASDGLYAAKQADGTMVGSHLHLSLSDAKEGKGKIGEFAIALKVN